MSGRRCGERLVWLPAWPMPLVITSLFLTIFASPCFGFGAYAVGYNPKKKQSESFLIVDRSTEQEAEDIALRACRSKSLTDCAIRYRFASTCIAIAFTQNRLIRFIDTDPSLEHARTKVMAACESRPGIKCVIGEAGCDRATASAPPAQSPLILPAASVLMGGPAPQDPPLLVCGSRFNRSPSVSVRPFALRS